MMKGDNDMPNSNGVASPDEVATLAQIADDQYRNANAVPDWATQLMANQKAHEEKLDGILEVVAAMRDEVMPTVHALVENPAVKMLLGNKGGK